MTLYAVSHDGTMGVFAFEPEELGGIASYDDQKTYLRRYAYQPPPVPQDYVHPGQTGDAPDQRPKRPSQPEVIHTLVAKRKDKRAGPRRVALTSSVPSASIPTAGPSRPISRATGPVVTPRQASNSVGMPSAALHPPEGITTDGFGFDDDAMDIGQGTVASIAALNTASPPTRRRSPGDVFGDEGRLKARTLGGDKQREVVPVRELVDSSRQPHIASAEIINQGQAVLPALSVLTVISSRTNQGTTECLLEGKNSESGCESFSLSVLSGFDMRLVPGEITYYSGRQTQWLDYVSAPIVAVAVTAVFGAAAMQDGTLNVYSLTGRRLMPTIMLGSPCSYLCASEGVLLALTSSGTLYSW
jgi:protein HIRA/HIR1